MLLIGQCFIQLLNQTLLKRHSGFQLHNPFFR